MQVTMAQLSYRRPDTAFRRSFGSPSSNGKPKDETTMFREATYTMWNTSGTKHPAGFRP